MLFARWEKYLLWGSVSYLHDQCNLVSIAASFSLYGSKSDAFIFELQLLWGFALPLLFEALHLTHTYTWYCMECLHLLRTLSRVQPDCVCMTRCCVKTESVSITPVLVPGTPWPTAGIILTAPVTGDVIHGGGMPVPRRHGTFLYSPLIGENQSL